MIMMMMILTMTTDDYDRNGYNDDYNNDDYFYADLISVRLKALNCDSRN